MDIEKLFDTLEIPKEDRGDFLEIFSEESLINEGLSTADRAIVKEIYTRLSNLLKTSLASIVLGILEIRRQIKATQREIAELSKKNDRERKEMESFRKETKKTLEEITRMIKDLPENNKEEVLRLLKDKKLI